MLIADRAPHQNATFVVAGVDTHKDTHHAAVLDLAGRILGCQPFPATAAGYERLLDWVAGHGVIDRVGVELTGSYGAGLTRHLTAAGVTVVEVNSSDKATRARRGKDDAIDAVAAAQKTLSGMASATPKDTTGSTESIRMLTMVRDLAVKQRTQTMNMIHAVTVTAPEPLRNELRNLTRAALLRHILQFQPDTARFADPTHAAMRALSALADRIQQLDAEIHTADKDLAALVQATAPSLLERPGIGVHTAARFLITVANNGGRIHSEAAFARLCGAAPIPASSGKTTRMRLHRGGDRQANRALHMIIVGRMKTHPTTKAYIAKKLAEGHSKLDAIRALKRFVAREVFKTLKTDHIIT
jgi:transposase